MLRLMSLIFFVLCLTFTTRSDTDMQQELPKLKDILPSLQRKPVVYDNMTSALNTIDLETLNLAKFRKKINSLRNDFRRKESSRRQAVMPIKQGSYMMGTDQRTRRKICDLMLQTIYMARHKIKEMQGSKYFKVTDTGYRVAYLFKHLSGIWKKLMTIYWTMRNHTEDWADVAPYLILHHKAVRFHIDFNNIWWVLVKLDGAFKDREAQDDARMLKD